MSARCKTYKPGFWVRFFLSQSWKLTLNVSSPGQLYLSAGRDTELCCAKVVSVAVRQGLIWHSVEISSRGRTDRLSGLSASKAQQLSADLLQFINNYLVWKIESDKTRLVEVDQVLQSLTQTASQYLSHADVSQAISCVGGDVAEALSHPLFDVACIPVSLIDQFPTSFEMLTDPKFRSRYNEQFVADEFRNYEDFFSNLGGISLSNEQREACIRLEDNNLLIASAGSGKTATMVGKVAYVLDKELYRPDEILVLAFNSDAASELRHRIALQLGVEKEALGCHVSTFHALGRGIIQHVNGRPPQLANWVGHPTGEAKFIEQIIQEQRAHHPEFRTIWTELLLLYPEADIPIELSDSKSGYQRDISGADRTIGTLAGLFVKSRQEQRIANWLWLRSVPFEYERQVPIQGRDGSYRFVEPDFYYPQTNTVHEHFAIDKNGESPFENYVEHAQDKRDGYRGGGFDFFETSSAQAQDETLLFELEAQLCQREIPLQLKSQEEIEQATEPVVIKRYHNLVSICIKHIRSSNLTLDMLLERAKTLKDPARARRFAQAVSILAEAYSKKLSESRRIDFESMIGDAVQLVESGRYRSPYSLILVDEFQDISEPRANLVKALQRQKSFTKIFAVGDDWQSIYRFAGSDITIFTHFQEYFGMSWHGYLQQTYRCNQLIADTAAQFVQCNPEQLKKSVRSKRASIARSIRVIPIKVEWKKPSFAEACDQILARLNAFAVKMAPNWQSEKRPKLKVLVLSRYNMTNPYKRKSPQFSHLEVSSLSFHRSKGLEADYTLLLDVSEGNYGVPSRIEDDELLHLVIPRPETYPYSEERRLFYVALTRASRGVFILINREQPSRYIKELQEIAGKDVQFETADGVAITVCPSCRVGHLVQRRTRSGRTFRGCSQYPKCRHTAPSE